MPLRLGSRQHAWTYAAADDDRVRKNQAPSTKTVGVLSRLVASVAAEVEDVPYKGHSPGFAFREATDRLAGRKLTAVYERARIDHKTFERRIAELEQSYGLSDLDPRRDHRPARAVLLLAAECRFVPLAEGVLAATEWWPASTRLDLRGAFQLVSRWWSLQEPRVLSRLAVSALSIFSDPHVEPRAWLPLTRLYAGVLEHHRAADRRGAEAQALSAETIRILSDAYERLSTKREIMQALFVAAEEMHIIEGRPSFDQDPELRRRQELTRILLDLELDRQLDPSSSRLVSLIRAGGRR